MPKHSDLTDAQDLHYSKIKTFSNVAPNLVIPDFAGQLLCDESDNQLYRATGTQPGNLQSLGVNITGLQQLLDDLAIELNSKANQIDFATHAADQGNPHNVTRAQIGAAPLSHTTDFDNPHQVTADQAGAIALDEKGAASGVCPLDGNIKIPVEYLPDGIGGGGPGDGNDSAPGYAWRVKAFPYLVTDLVDTTLYAWGWELFRGFPAWMTIELPNDSQTRNLFLNEVPTNLEMTWFVQSNLETPVLTILWDGVDPFPPTGITYTEKVFICLEDRNGSAQRTVNLDFQIIVVPPNGN